jgi:hypothetical protein
MQVETQRLVIREFKQEDFRQLAPILANPQVMKITSQSYATDKPVLAVNSSVLDSELRCGWRMHKGDRSSCDSLLKMQYRFSKK